MKDLGSRKVRKYIISQPVTDCTASGPVLYRYCKKVGLHVRMYMARYVRTYVCMNVCMERMCIGKAGRYVCTYICMAGR